MKRRDLERRIARRAAEMGLEWSLLRRNGDHDIYLLDGLRLSIPRHTELSDGVTRRLLRDAEVKLGKGWWR